MTIVNPNLVANLFVQPSNQSVLAPELRQLELRIDQVVRATVVEGGLHKVLFELNDQLFKAETEAKLQVGQQLRLQVTQTQPHLEFQVLGISRPDRLAELMPLLTRSYDWGALVERLPHFPPKVGGEQFLKVVLPQLQQLLSSAGDIELNGLDRLSKVIAHLQAAQSADRPLAAVTSPSLTPYPSLEPAVGSAGLAVRPVDRVVIELVLKLQGQIGQLKQIPENKPVPTQWLNQTRELLQPLHQDNRFVQNFSFSSRSLLLNSLLQLRAQAKVTPQLGVELDKIIGQIKQHGSPFLAPYQSSVPRAQGAGSYGVHAPSPGRVVNGSVTTEGGIPAGGLKSSAAAEPVVLPEVAVSAGRPDSLPSMRIEAAGSSGRAAMESGLGAELKQLLSIVHQIQEQKSGLSAELFGRLEGLVIRLRRAAADNVTIVAGVDPMIGQLSQLLTQQNGPQRSLSLGVLSQLFGFYLEAELLQGKTKDALASLKLSLLQLQSEMGEELTEPLKRLELFQLCKARFAEEQVQFMPLPFADLEEGYLLAEKRGDGQDQNGRQEVNLSLSLRLSALGNVRIDMLYCADEGLKMQVAGDGLEKKKYLEGCVDELHQSIQAVKLQTVSFSADAELPAKQLQARLLPEKNGMLDARI